MNIMSGSQIDWVVSYGHRDRRRAGCCSADCCNAAVTSVRGYNDHGGPPGTGLSMASCAVAGLSEGGRPLRPKERWLVSHADIHATHPRCVGISCGTSTALHGSGFGRKVHAQNASTRLL